MSNNVKWNDEQALAISAREGNFLISASAGSGKTAVLTERVYQLISEGTKLNELLILTFTDMAAASMRNKIRDKLNENHLEHLASLIDAVNIQTFDAFALSIVKKYHYLINLDAEIKIVDKGVIELEKKKILDRLFLKKYEENNPSFTNLIKRYCLDNDTLIRDFVLKIDAKSDLKINKDELLDSYVNVFLSKEKIKNNLDEILKEIKEKVDYFISLTKEFDNVDYANALLEQFLYRFERVKDVDELIQLYKDKSLVIPRASGKLSLADYPLDAKKRAIIKTTLNEKYRSYFNYESTNEIYSRYEEDKPHVEELVNLVKELNVELNAFKKKYSIYTFQDIFKFAIKILSIKEISDKFRNQFRYIMIDEYQDTNDLQEEFIKLFSNNNVYVVGDVKQSIYRFRNANCDLFLSKFNTYPLFDKNKKSLNNRIDLPKNYRSRTEVLNTVNELFGELLNYNDTGLNYKRDHMMYPGNNILNSFKDPTFDYKTSAITYVSQENINNIEYEARLVAKDIVSKINSHIQIQTKEGSRDITFSDFAILSYSKADFKIYQQVFEEYKIPLFAKYDESIHDSDLTIVLENIIKAIAMIKNNEIEDSKFAHIYMSIARSFLFNYSDEYLHDIIINKNYEGSDAFDSLIKTTKEIEGKNLKDSILIIIKEFDIYQRAITIGNISKSIELLNYYYKIASQMDEMQYSLDDFGRYFEELDEFDIDPNYESADMSSDSVKLLSIHASKGLEYRFVYLIRLNKQMNLGDVSSKFQVDNRLGIDLPNYNYPNPSNINHFLIGFKEKKDAILEQLRILYVALTRAQEHLILLIKEDYKKDPAISLFESTSYMDFINIAGLSYRVLPPLEEQSLEIKPSKEEHILLTLHREVNLSKEEIIMKRASKEVEDADSELLALGTKYHYYLELIDFNNIDTSFIKDKKDKYLIDRFLSNPIFHQKGLLKASHEYAFYDESNNVHGFIDLLLIYEDHIDIVDFKLSHVDDVKYERQLDIYKDYVSQITTKPIHQYVTGIMSGDIKKIS